MNAIEKKSAIESALKTASASLMQSGKGTELAKISSDLESTTKSPVCLLVCGEFKRGKSTFVNALIGRNICATDVDICTSVVSIIKYGEKESVTRYYGDFSDPKSEQISLDDLEKYTVGSADDIDNTIYVEISLPLPALKEGLMIIDTPGVGGLDPRHAALTNLFMPKADIALFMTDVNEPVTSTELTYLNTKVLPFAKQTVIIVNKSDLKDSDSVEEIRLDTINKVAAVTQCPKEEITALAISSAAEAHPDDDLGESNFAGLRALIADLVEKHREESLDIIKANLLELIELTLIPIRTQLEQIENPDINRVQDLTLQKDEIDKKIAELSDPNSTFRTNVSREITSKREEIANYINEASVTLQSETFNKLLSSPQAKADNGGAWFGQMLNDAVTEIGTEVTMLLDSAFDEIAQQPQFEGMLQFETKDYVSHIVIRNVDVSVPINRRITPMMSGVGIASFGSMLATGPIGVIAALGIGSYIAFRNQKDAGNMYSETQLRQVYQPQLSGAISSLNTYVNTRFTEFQQEWLNVITGRCKAYKTSLQEALENIQKAKLAINQSVTLKAQLQSKLKPLMEAEEKLK